MRYAYYAKLGKADKATYRRSDDITAIPLNGVRRLRPIVERLKRDLASEDRRRARITVWMRIARLLRCTSF